VSGSCLGAGGSRQQGLDTSEFFCGSKRIIPHRRQLCRIVWMRQEVVEDVRAEFWIAHGGRNQAVTHGVRIFPGIRANEFSHFWVPFNRQVKCRLHARANALALCLLGDTGGLLLKALLGNKQRHRVPMDGIRVIETRSHEIVKLWRIRHGRITLDIGHITISGRLRGLNGLIVLLSGLFIAFEFFPGLPQRFTLGVTLGLIRRTTSTSVAMLVHAAYDMVAVFTT